MYMMLSSPSSKIYTLNAKVSVKRNSFRRITKNDEQGKKWNTKMMNLLKILCLEKKKIEKEKETSADELGPHIERWKEIKLKLKAATTKTQITKRISLFFFSSNFGNVYPNIERILI